MDTINHWLLPEGVEEILPPYATQLDALRQTLLTRFQRWGYQYVITPFIEFEESLLQGAGRDLALQTFRLTDQISGRQLAIRPDITPQLARIDAHRLQVKGVARYCYAGTVLRTRPNELAGSRSPLQIGIELYGYAGIEADLEVLQLLLASLSEVPQPLHLDLSHVAIFSALVQWAGLDTQQEQAYFDILQRKAVTELNAFLDSLSLSDVQRDALYHMIQLCGDASVLDKATALFAQAPSSVMAALAQLKQAVVAVQQACPSIGIFIDLGELRGYHYHTGLVFAVYTPGIGKPVATGGRYDYVGEQYGRSRPATGFSIDLKLLNQLMPDVDETPQMILAPFLQDDALLQKVAELRQNGEIVQFYYPNEDEQHYQAQCNRKIIAQDGDWVLVNWA